MKTKTYNKTKPYGKIVILQTGKRYILLAPHPIDEIDTWQKEAGMQAWSVVSGYDGMPDMMDYSEELQALLHDEALTLVVHPFNILVELSDQMNDMYYWSGEYQEEAEDETEVDLSEDDNYLMPDYLLDVVPVLLDEQYPINDAPYFPDEFYQIPPMMDDGFPV